MPPTYFFAATVCELFFGRFCYSFQNVSPDTCNPLYIIINHKVPKTKVMKVDSILFVLHGVVCGGAQKLRV